MTFPFRLEPLGEEYERTLFRCGEDALDRYFHTQVTQDIRRHVANCFVAVETATRTLKPDAAAFTLLVDAKNDQAVAFYQRFGFRVLASQPRILFLPLATA